MLDINNLYVKIKNNLIIKGLNLKIKNNEIHIIMGPNGSGKSTLSYVISGKQKYIIEKGKILFNNKLINNLSPYEISKLGIYLSFQYPIEINGITMYSYLKTILKKKYNNRVILKKIYKVCKKLKINKNYLYRYFNVGFSGGEKKKNEILQMLLLKPKLVILDEIDSGLDIDTLNIIFKNINKYKKKYKCSIIIITHNTNIIKYINTNYVHILYNGKIIKSSNKNIIEKIEKYGYKKIVKQ
ncbi:Fe-S cluster assembly ATPase SufC [Candidatus Shikimatogenerans bostrichidophilus]|uniref:Fe-S cluster assembly ATPase SufC n=1 Tax=Candidatus Shikimatogenerans bostrichidophilus TaxID=2943807 RepID=UPI0029665C9A